MKKIALLYSGSNPERQREKIKELHKSFAARGAAVYVLSCYDAMGGKLPVGDQAVYTLAHEDAFDGCVIDDFINAGFTKEYLINGEVLKNKASVFCNAGMEQFCCVGVDTYAAIYEMLEHLVVKHGCKKINMVANFTWLAERYQEFAGVTAYRDICKKYGIEFDEKRLIDLPVSMEKAETLPEIFTEKGVDDCDAVFLNADINAIGLFNYRICYAALGVSIGFAVHEAGSDAPFSKIIEMADESMYADKVSRK